MNKSFIICNKLHISDILTCPICLEYYNIPRNLFCGHSYCTKCLHTLTINNQIICPLCRYCNDLSEYNIINLPVNSTLISLIDSKSFENINISPHKKPLKRSKSADCLIHPKKNNKSNTIYINQPQYIEDVNCFTNFDYNHETHYFCCFQ